MIYVYKENDLIKLKSVISTNDKIIDRLKLDLNIKIKEKVYDNDTELEFIIKDRSRL